MQVDFRYTKQYDHMLKRNNTHKRKTDNIEGRTGTMNTEYIKADARLSEGTNLC